jgi:hypothetical protein
MSGVTHTGIHRNITTASTELPKKSMAAHFRILNNVLIGRIPDFSANVAILRH